jgi:hypothetical protein
MRKSRAQKPINWENIFNSLTCDGYIRVPVPPHLTVVTMRDYLEIQSIYLGRPIQCLIIMGHLLVKAEGAPN